MIASEILHLRATTMTPSFGIDFGTTNTRVAHFEGRFIRCVPFENRDRTVGHQMPTAIAYQHGRPVAYGDEALAPTLGKRFSRPLKWMLKSADEVDVEGGIRDPVEAVADFLMHLKRTVGEELPGRWPGIALDRTAVTIPVDYPTAARRRLREAFAAADIEVTHFFYEPIAAMYAGMVDERASGTMAVFDWGGGSLDIATVEVRDRIALTRELAGWHRGGTDFDRMIAVAVANEFLSTHRGHPGLVGITTDLILDRMKEGPDLLSQAQSAKESLGQQVSKNVNVRNLLGIDSVSHPITQTDLAEIIAPDLKGAMSRLERVMDDSGVTVKTLAKLFLSGGTCYLNDIQSRFACDFGNRVVGSLRLPPRFVGPNAGGLTDIGNATAIGGALLAAYGQAPVFSASIGVRLAGDRSGEQFHTVYNAGDPVRFNAPRKERFFIADASHGSGRLLVCERHDATEPAGRLIRMIPVPIHPTEHWLDVTFTIDRHLTLNVKAIGRQNVRPESSRYPPHKGLSEDIPALKLGFPLPV